MQHCEILDLVDLVYAAAQDPAEWSAFLNALSNAFEGTGASLAFASFDRGDVGFQSGVGIIGADFQKEYVNVASRDPWLLRSKGGRLWKTGTIGVGEDLVPMRELQRTDFYNEFGRRHGYVGGLTSVLLADDSGMAAVSVCRRVDGAFGEREVAVMRVLMPHLCRALQVHTRLQDANARVDGLQNALNRMETAAIVLDKSGMVLFANDSARETLSQRDGLTLERGAIRAARSSDNANLRALIAGASIDVASAGALLVGRPSMRRPLQLLVSPVTKNHTLRDRGARVMLFVTDPERLCEPDLDLLRRFHALGPAEAQVARLLLQNKSVREIAELLGISANTVRFHLKQLFSKTGTRRQSELISLLLRTMQVRNRSEPYNDRKSSGCRDTSSVKDA